MPKRKKNRNKKKNQHHVQTVMKIPSEEEKKSNMSTESSLPGNYVADSLPGCYIVHYDAPWLMGVEPFSFASFGLAEGAKVPDISIDPAEGILTVINSSQTNRCFQLTLSHAAITEQGSRLPMGTYRNQTGEITEVITFILLVRPMQIMDVCTIVLPPHPDAPIDLTSSITDLKQAPAKTLKLPTSLSCKSYNFPLQGNIYICIYIIDLGFIILIAYNPCLIVI